MSRVLRALGWVGGVAGAAVTGAAVSAAAHSARVSQQRRRADDPLADEPLGQLVPDRESTVAADDGVPLSVEEVDPADGGEPELTVVLVHGFALDRRCWHFQRRDLAKLTGPRVQLVLYDQRGHGRSGSSADGSTIDQLARDLDAVLRAVVPKGQLVLVGHSMGGMTIMALAEQRPQLFADRVRGVALVGTAAGAVGGAGLQKSLLSRYNPVTLVVGRLAGFQPGVVEWARRSADTLTWSGIRALAFGDRSVSPSLVDLMDDMISGVRVKVLTDFLETLGTHDRYRALAGLRHCEVLVIGGDADRMTPFSHAERMAQEMPHGELVRAPGAGHMVMMEQPELVTGHVIDLIRRSADRPEEERRRWWRRA